jgi:hypothetical protein
LVIAALAGRAWGDHITRRGTEPGLDGTIINVNDNGVSIRSGTGAEHAVTWDRIREVQTDDPSLQRGVDEYRDTALALWRARSRLDRGDMAMAEPLFDRLFAEYRGRTSETALIVAEGVLRCRLARGADDTAIIPALEVARLRRKGVKTTAYSVLPEHYDEATALWQRLPPAWAPTSALARVEAELKSYDAGGDTVVAALASLYRAAARQQMNLAPEEAANLALDHPGVALMRSLVMASSADSDQRAAARAALEKRRPELPEWALAWSYFAIGESLLRESGLGQRERGVVSLAHLPATFRSQQPYLAALALARMSAALASMGDAAGAAVLRTELERTFPNHPALQALESTVGGRPPANTSAAHPAPPAAAAANIERPS